MMFTSSRQVGDCALSGLPGSVDHISALSTLFSYVTLWQPLDVFHQPLPIRGGDLRPQRVVDRTFQRLLPARTYIMHVSSPASGFSGCVHQDAIRRTHQPDQFPFGENRSAANTGALWYMLHPFLRFLSHLSCSLLYSSQPQSSPPRLCFFCTTVRSRSGS